MGLLCVFGVNCSVEDAMEDIYTESSPGIPASIYTNSATVEFGFVG